MIDNTALSAALSSLDSLAGLEGAKEQVRQIVGLKRVLDKRAEAGLPTFPFQQKNMLFLGNPGTGKSLFARHLGEIYRALGVLSKGHVIECDRSQLVVGYIGQTPPKTQQMIEKARGGILFIDNADILNRGGNNRDFGVEALDTILRAISEPDVDLAVVLAGYDEPMADFLNANPSVSTKFPLRFHFDDLTADTLYDIFMKHLEKYRVAITDEAREAVRAYFEDLVKSEDRWGNARVARNCFEEAFSSYMKRIADRLQTEDVKDLPIELCDIPKINKS